MKRWIWTISIIAVVLVMGLLFLRLNEDSWIKDSRGVYVLHGNPSQVPEEVQKQQEAINCANDIYVKAKGEGMSFSSQCLGTCGDFAIDIVRIPRSADDARPDNQCLDYRSGKVAHFIELDKEGNVVRAG